MKFYNSLTKKIEEFKPLYDGKIIMYVCGLTPYDNTHLGHARTYVAFDMLKRFFILKGYEVFHIQNITDVDDKIIKKANETNQKPNELTEKFHSEAMELFKKLHILDANIYPKVTEHIPEIIGMIETLIKKDFAYETETGVYFEVGKFPKYGALSGQKIDEIRAGTRKEVDETKKNSEDFALWKKTNSEIIEFSSPWGRGRPGWHIECSAMIGKYSNMKTLDIHGGARDLIFPHHENEIAQSESANEVQFVKYWLHTGFLTVNNEKMSKCLGNFVTLRDVLTNHTPNAVRLFFALTNYRSHIDYNPTQIKQAEVTVKRILNFMDKLNNAISKRKKKNMHNKELINETKSKFRNFYHFLESDFDMPTAITYIFSIMKSANTVFDDDAYDYETFGLIKKEMENALYVLGIENEIKKPEDKSAQLIELLIELRDDARKRKDFKVADKIRDKLKQICVLLEDNGTKTTWKIQ